MTRKKSCNDLSSVLKELPNYLRRSEIYPTETFIIDFLLNGGFETGSFVQLLGDSGCGKTTMALQIATSLCKYNKKVLFVDTESSITEEQLSTTGVLPYLGNNLFYVRESTFDKVEEVLDNFISTGEVNMIILDSLPGLINSCFLDLNSGISIMTNSSLYASRPLTNFMSKYKSLASSENFCLLFTNQWRQRISTTGSVDKPYGSKSVHYNSDIVIKISKMTTSGPNKDFKALYNSVNSGLDLDIELVKSNKRKPGIYPCHLKYGFGIANRYNMVYALLKKNVIKKNGSYFEFNDGHIIIKENGISNFLKKLLELNVNLYDYNPEGIYRFYDELNLDK